MHLTMATAFVFVTYAGLQTPVEEIGSVFLATPKRLFIKSKYSYVAL